MNYVRRFRDLDQTVMVTWAFSFGALALLPLAAGIEGLPLRLDLPTTGAVLFLGVVLTGLAFVVAFRIMPRAGATKTSTVTFIAPISALLIGTFVLGEELGALHLAGMAAIFLGLLLIDGRLILRKTQPSG
jgi:drug/metabolite transporter (DMT)-like permease